MRWARAGFSDVQVYGVEGPGWPALDTVSAEAFAAEQDTAPALYCAEFIEQDPPLIHTSAHLLAVGAAADLPS